MVGLNFTISQEQGVKLQVQYGQKENLFSFLNDLSQYFNIKIVILVLLGSSLTRESLNAAEDGIVCIVLNC